MSFRHAWLFRREGYANGEWGLLTHTIQLSMEWPSERSNDASDPLV